MGINSNDPTGRGVSLFQCGMQAHVAGGGGALVGGALTSWLGPGAAGGAAVGYTVPFIGTYYACLVSAVEQKYSDAEEIEVSAKRTQQVITRKVGDAFSTVVDKITPDTPVHIKQFKDSVQTKQATSAPPPKHKLG